MRKLIFLMLVIVLTSCGEEVINDPKEATLFLRSASVDEGKNDILFRVSALGDQAEVVNNKDLKIEDFKILSGQQALFTVSDGGLISIIANKLPFLPNDYAPQTENGNARFNGVLKSKNFVFSINGGDIKILDLRTDFLTTTIASINNDSYNFKVGTEILRLRLTKISPENGNIFQLFVLYNENENDIAYSLLTK